MPILSLKNKTSLGSVAHPGDVDPGAMIPLATTTLGTAAADITFSSIPLNYEHLQIRGISRGTASLNEVALRVRFNSDTGSNYARHLLEGEGTTAASYATASGNLMTCGNIAAATGTASVFGATLIDVLDYANTNKYKTIRVLDGNDRNGGGTIDFASGLWMNTNAITSISLFADSGNLAQYSSFALYGIKRAGA